jgi:hypothetical protein
VSRIGCGGPDQRNMRAPTSAVVLNASALRTESAHRLLSIDMPSICRTDQGCMIMLPMRPDYIVGCITAKARICAPEMANVGCFILA